MKIAVLSDIHGNFEALEAVSRDIADQFVDQVILLGDNIGYGPDPEKVIGHIRQMGYVSVLGNHEFALADQRGRRWLNFQAAENNRTTEGLLSASSITYCRGLPLFFEAENGYFVHGFPPASVFLYLDRQSNERITTLFDRSTAVVYFVGHTHRLQLVTKDACRVIRRKLGQETVVLTSGQKYIVSCGSVGQPRDGNNQAKYLVWDVDLGKIVVQFVDYDREATMRKIRSRGFPEVYALQLR